jgi:hypothetical protein
VKVISIGDLDLNSILLAPDSILRSIAFCAAFRYSRGMELTLDIHAGRLHLLVAPHPAVDRLTDAFIARLALDGEVRALDGGNRFDAHQVARHIRRQTPALEPTLERVTIARAFTCYQMAALLAGQPPGASPLLVLNLLTTFHDENVPQAERLRLLGQCLADLKRLAGRAPVLVSAAPAHTPQAAGFLARLAAAADHTWRLDVAGAPVQARLI